MRTDPEQRVLLMESRRQEVVLLDNEIAFNEAIIEERDQGVQEIQQQIGEVNEIFKDLAVLVHEQGTMIDDIGSNIESSSAATAQAKSQIVKAIYWSLQMELQTISMILFVVIFILSIGSSSCGEAVYKGKYITQNYFNKYNKLTIREFDNFIANEIPSGLSKIVTDKNNAEPTLSVLRRDVIGEGSHRRLSSSIRFKLQHELKYELTAHSCEVIIIERLPNGVFADPFELQHLVERDEFTDAAVFGDTNLELPSFRSNQSVVEIHMSFASKVFSRNEDDSEVNLDLPLHARYPPLGHGFSRVEFGQPDIFICCGLDGNVRNRSCLLMSIDHIVDNKASTVIWDVPCGNKEHARVVSAVTFGFAIVSTMLIVLTSVCCYSGSQGSDNLKLS